MRVRDKKLRLCGECSTMTRRWRPEEARGRRGARARGHQGRGKRSGSRGDDAWACVAAGGGARGPVPVVSGGGRAEQREGSGGARGRRSRQESEGLVRDFQRVQGPPL
jgi:hypothetical protein